MVGELLLAESPGGTTDCAVGVGILMDHDK